MGENGRINVAVVVLGDLGRSPRMRYHALALADAVADVDLVGYAGSALPQAMREHLHIRCHKLKPRSFLPAKRKSALFVAASLFKIAMQSIALTGMLLFAVRKPDVILLQSPPAIPTLAVALLVARLRGAKLIVDWHNFGYTLLALKLGRSSPIIRWARRYERFFARRADGHLCVSRAMQTELEGGWRLPKATLLHDRPAPEFAPAETAERMRLLRGLGDRVASGLLGTNGSSRPGILVSPTSWTEDEDFDVLLDALAQCDEALGRLEPRLDGQDFPGLVVFITGRGPRRAHYEERLARIALRRIDVRTLWLSPEDYPLLLRAADLGLCLHRSSSGVDLPMKVADMLGSGLPVCAFDYGPCLSEQLKDGENGLLFSSPSQLARQLLELFKGFPECAPLLERLRRNVAVLAQPCWPEEWKERALPVITGSVDGRE